MAEPTRSIFNKQATDRLLSPDDLDRYVRVTSPSVWVALLAIVALLAGILAWGIFGAVSTSVSAVGTCVEGRALCLLDAESVANVHEGDFASVGGRQVTVASVSATPLSRAEASELLGSDYLVDALMDGEWGYLVTFDGDAGIAEGTPATVSITTERVAPISLVLG